MPDTRPILPILRRTAVALTLPLILSACSSELLFPGGDVAAQQRDILGVSTLLMLLIVIPVMVAIVAFAWHYRASNRQATYDPGFHHSASLELLIWAAPLVIIIWLGAVTWVGTHKLDPYRPLDRISATQPLQEGVEPLIVQTVSMEWKWLFFYPQYGIATVNELAAPVDRPIRFELTSTEVMTAFYVPTLAGMIYTMSGMETKLNAVANQPGEFLGMASHYNGAGFSGMRFPFHAMPQQDFDAWVASARDSGQVLDRDAYRELLKPSENVPAARFAIGDTELYHDILNRCVEPGQVCMNRMMAMDGHGGGHGAQPADSASTDAGHDMSNMAGHEMPADAMQGHDMPEGHVMPATETPAETPVEATAETPAEPAADHGGHDAHTGTAPAAGN